MCAIGGGTPTAPSNLPAAHPQSSVIPCAVIILAPAMTRPLPPGACRLFDDPPPAVSPCKDPSSPRASPGRYPTEVLSALVSRSYRRRQSQHRHRCRSTRHPPSCRRPHYRRVPRAARVCLVHRQRLHHGGSVRDGRRGKKRGARTPRLGWMLQDEPTIISWPGETFETLRGSSSVCTPECPYNQCYSDATLGRRVRFGRISWTVTAVPIPASAGPLLSRVGRVLIRSIYASFSCGKSRVAPEIRG